MDVDGGPESKRPRKGEAAGVTVVLGGQWGDEGKGKLVDILAQDADVVCRCQVRTSIYQTHPPCTLLTQHLRAFREATMPVTQ